MHEPENLHPDQEALPRVHVLTVDAFLNFDEVALPTDPNELYDAWAEAERFGVARADDIDAFAAAYFGADPADRSVQPRLYAFLEPGRDRFLELDPEDQEECRTALKRFVARRTS